MRRHLPRDPPRRPAKKKAAVAHPAEERPCSKTMARPSAPIFGGAGSGRQGLATCPPAASWSACPPRAAAASVPSVTPTGRSRLPGRTKRLRRCRFRRRPTSSPARSPDEDPESSATPTAPPMPAHAVVPAAATCWRRRWRFASVAASTCARPQARQGISAFGYVLEFGYVSRMRVMLFLLCQAAALTAIVVGLADPRQIRSM